ncbi:uncharacterized protein RSE6_13771 [Rhynchosporium secalis]|uniref:Uncharacterized protein n=1 Tax=Rhynchosporium secalis TaxID=38038 RepID=A0A1E1MTM6_RHYSE|nr:uncharacterized protein RSE6_13771 [Rhynchosporium secalis]
MDNSAMRYVQEQEILMQSALSFSEMQRGIQAVQPEHEAPVSDRIAHKNVYQPATDVQSVELSIPTSNFGSQVKLEPKMEQQTRKDFHSYPRVTESASASSPK